jgi:hypothetical protein
MKFFKPILRDSSAVILLILFLSCGASHKLRNEVEYQDGFFKYQNLKQDGLVVGGIGSYMVNLPPATRMDYNSIIYNSLLEKLRDAHLIHLTNTAQVIEKMGKVPYFKMMESFDIIKKLNKDKMAALRDTLGQSKYLLMTYILNENIVDDSFSEEIIEDNQEKTETHYKKTYFLTVEFQIYDLRQEKMVWRNTIYNQAENTESRTTSSGCVEGCIDGLLQEIFMGTPADIDREEVLQEITNRFAADLPQKIH